MPLSLPNVLSWFLLPFSWLYGSLVGVRNLGYDAGIISRKRLSLPVISVGNLTVGGSGKTPVVRYLASQLNQRNLRVAVLTRGYGRKTGETLILQQDTVADYGLDRTGDEARMLARQLENGTVVVDKDRFRGGKSAMADPRPDVFILDDGFQHRRLHRDLNIVTLDAQAPFDNHRLLPAGRLRETPGQLRRADLLWVTRLRQSGVSEATVRQSLERFRQIPMVLSDHCVEACIAWGDQTMIPLQDLQGREAVAFCGIAQPESFRQSLSEIGVKSQAFFAFGDHHDYGDKDMAEISRAVASHGSCLLLTTEKDASRLSPHHLARIPEVHILKLEIRILSGGDHLKKCLKRIGLS